MGSHAIRRASPGQGAARGRRRAQPRLAQGIADDIRRLVRALRDASLQVQRESGLSLAQLFVLRELASADWLSVGELAARTLTHQSSVSVVAQKLCAKGLLQRRPGRDARRVELSLTLRGRRLLERAPAPPQRRLFDAVAGLPARTREELGRSLAALVARLGLSESAPDLFFEEKSPDA